jgi:Protein of unknown function (DUF1302)
MNKMGMIRLFGAAACGSFIYGQAYAYTFDTGLGDLTGSWVSNLTGGAGIRTKDPACSLTGDPNANGCGSAANTAQWSNGDEGDLNYNKGHAFTGYMSVTSELLLLMPNEGYKFLIRGTAMYDFLADDTDRTSLSSTAKAQAVYNAELLDLWAQKDFQIGDQRVRFMGGRLLIMIRCCTDRFHAFFSQGWLHTYPDRCILPLHAMLEAVPDTGN